MITFPHPRGERKATLGRQDLRSFSHRTAAALRAIPVATDPLRSSRDFRLLWLSALTAGMGMGAVGLAVLVHLYDLTASPAAVGSLGLVQFVAMLLGMLGGSAIVDHADRRIVLIATEIGFGLNGVVLLLASLGGAPPPGLIYASSAFGSAVAALHFPTRSAMIPPVVRRSELTTAMTLETAVWNATMILGPLVGGAIVERAGLPAAYGFSVAAHAATLPLMSPLRPQPRSERTSGERTGIDAIRRGFAYLRRRPVLRGLLWIDLIAMAFGMRRSLFPILAAQRFQRGPSAAGLLMAAIPAGALLVSLGGNWLSRIRRQGLGLVVAAGVWGAAVAAFGISGDNLWIALALLALAGGADIVAAILRASIIQREVPDHMRGRVWGINFVVLNGGPRLGDLSGGVTASAWGATPAVVVGGLAALLGTVLYALAVPALPRYTSEDSIHPVEDPAPWRET